MIAFFVRFLLIGISALLGWVEVSLLGVGGTWVVLGPLFAGAAAILAIGLESSITKKHSTLIPTVIFGFLLGVILANVFDFVVPVFLPYFALRPETEQDAAQIIRAGLVMLCSYLSITVVLKTRHLFRFIIPYVEFSKQGKGVRPLVLDTSVIIDGRVADMADTGIIDSPLVIAKFVLRELQNIADSADKLKRNRGRRGLEMLSRLQKNSKVNIEVDDSVIPGAGGVDNKLVRLAKRLDGRIMTNDFNLAKIAQLQGVEVVNINDVAGSMKPIVLPGEEITIKIVKAGEEPGQGIGYLEDGTMVVVEKGREKVGKEVSVLVTSVFQSSAGKMLFGRPREESEVGAYHH